MTLVEWCSGQDRDVRTGEDLFLKKYFACHLSDWSVLSSLKHSGFTYSPRASD